MLQRVATVTHEMLFFERYLEDATIDESKDSLSPKTTLLPSNLYGSLAISKDTTIDQPTMTVYLSKDDPTAIATIRLISLHLVYHQ
jgi:hypothetical protein